MIIPEKLIGKSGSSNEDPRMTDMLEDIPQREVFVQDTNGDWIGTGMLMLSDGSLLAPEGFGAESGSVKFGDLINLSEASGYLAIYNYLDKSQYQMVDYHVPKDAPTSKPKYIWLYEAENEYVAQPDQSVQLNANPLVFSYTTQLQSRVNSINIKAYNVMTNVRLKITDVNAGVVVKYYPSKAAWSGEDSGVTFNLGDNKVEFGDSPLLFSPATTLRYEITADSVSILGNASGIPYLSGMLQRGETITLADEKDIQSLQQSAFSGDYNDLQNKPSIPSTTSDLTNDSQFITSLEAPVQSVNGQKGNVSLAIPAAQVASDWNATTGVTQILNKPTSFTPSAHTHAISDVTGLQSALDTKTTISQASTAAPVQSVNGQTGNVSLTIPAAQIQSDWNQANTSALDYIKNKPAIPTVNYPVTSVNTKTGAVVLTNTDVGAAATVHTHTISDITNLQTTLNGKYNTPTGTTGQYVRGDGTLSTFPSIPASQVNSDWSASTGVAQILNKPTTLSGYGITDAVTQSALNTTLNGYVTTNSLSATLGSYVTSSSLSTALSGYATTSALTSGLSSKFNTPSGTISQYVRGDGSLSNFPTIPTVPTVVSAFTNDVGYITTVTSAQVTAALGYTPYNGAINPNSYITQAGARSSISLTTTGTSGAATYNSTTGVLNIPNYSTSLPNVGTAGSYSGTVTTDAQGRVVAGTNRSFTNPTRSLNTAFQISTSQDALVSYAVDISASALLLAGTAGRVILEYANEAAFTSGVTTVQQSMNSAGGVLNVATATTATLTGCVPSGKYVRLRTVNISGTPTFTMQTSQEVLL